jgi:hypothetical protein
MTYYPSHVLCAICQGKLAPLQIVVRNGVTLCLSCSLATSTEKEKV